ncbi:MAG: hypothetical protein MI810_12560 [Flavobacteriales bacterium]|nr:hypothetical protein [Flavobacteriales bacterium]
MTKPEHYFLEKKFVRETCLQIQKDLQGLVDCEIQTDESDPLFHLQGLIVKVLEELSNGSGGKLMQFIYKVDLSEKKSLELLMKGDLKELAYLIIEREAQKVYLRRRFKTN